LSINFGAFSFRMFGIRVSEECTRKFSFFGNSANIIDDLGQTSVKNKIIHEMLKNKKNHTHLVYLLYHHFLCTPYFGLLVVVPLAEA